jgi:hypothetical protein
VVDTLKLDKSAALKDSFQQETAGDGNFKDWIASMLLRKLDHHAKTVMFWKLLTNNDQSTQQPWPMHLQRLISN